MSLFESLLNDVRKHEPVVPAVAAAESEWVLGGLRMAREEGLITRPILTGNRAKIQELIERLNGNFGEYEILDAPNESMAAAQAVQAVASGRAGVLMKGRLKTEAYMRAILDKDQGIRVSRFLSNLTLFELPGRARFLGVTDNGIIPRPGLEEKKAIIENTRPLWNALGISPVKVAVLAAVETVTPRFPSTLDAACLSKMSERGQLPGFLVDGPLAYDTALSAECARSKQITTSPVAGDPDFVVAPDLESANILGKSFKLHAGASWGGIIFGASVPIVFNSRSDPERQRFHSVVLARAISAVLNS